MAYLVSEKEILAAIPKLKYFGGKLMAKLFLRITKINILNKFYSKNHKLPALEFSNAVFKHFGIKYSVSPEDMSKIPETGPYVIISNHPSGGPEALVLMHICIEHRADFKFMANFILTRIDPLKEHMLAVNPFEDRKDAYSSLAGIKNTMLHLKSGAGMGIFPAGEVSSYNSKRKCITDKEWNPVVIKMIKKAQVPVIPVYIDAKNSKWFYFLGKIHPLLRTIKLPSELINKKKKVFKINIGNPISIQDTNAFENIEDFSDFLRFKTYSLSQKIRPLQHYNSVNSELPIIAETNKELIEKELSQMNSENFLFQTDDYKVFVAASAQIPNVLREIGRLREITYREVGEGTGKSIDTDEYDLYYHHLFIWDQNAKSIVGAYRIAKGKEVIAAKGLHGFYIRSLFGISDLALPLLEQTIELGRSFIRKEYQKKPLSLFLLWKGILYFLIKNPEYRYLLGPLSISNAFSDLSKSIIMEFLNRNFANKELQQHFIPKMPFNPEFPEYCPIDKLLNYTGNDVSRLDKIIHDIEPVHKIPVLLKKYLKLNACAISANVDPNFNFCLDVLMLMDIQTVPKDIIESLSKEISETISMKK